MAVWRPGNDDAESADGILVMVVMPGSVLVLVLVLRVACLSIALLGLLFQTSNTDQKGNVRG